MPIFRDRHELAAAGDLGREIRDALASSRFLIVLCSPAAAASKWTGAEIDSFKKMRPDGCILAAIIEGEPFASEIPGREAEECFPLALRHKYDKRGRPTKQRAEPIAADFREHGDGRRLGFLKIVAGMLGVGLDDLVQREAHRRQKRLRMVVAASLAGMTVTSGLAVTSVLARNEAREQRREAEGLVGFMLGDLRGKLEPIGRLDALDAVGERALAYFEKQDKGDLSDEGLAQRSRALTLMGEIAFTRGDLDGALRRYREAVTGTSEALRRTPGSAQALFDQAQNVFWVGYIDWQRGDTDAAAKAFREYKRLAVRMAAAAPGNTKYKLEGIYADTNLGIVLLDQRQYATAAQAFRRSLRTTEALAAAAPLSSDYQKQYANTLAYLSDALSYSGEFEEAVAHRERQLALVDRQYSVTRDVNYRDHARTAHRALGRLFMYRGEVKLGLEHARTASRLADELIRMEPANTLWLEFGAGAQLDLGQSLIASGDRESAGAAVRSGCDNGAKLIAKDPSVAAWSGRLQRQCLTARARLALDRGATGEAIGLGRAALATFKTRPTDPDDQHEAALAHRLIGEADRVMGDRASAARQWNRALAGWPEQGGEPPPHLADRAVLLKLIGDSAGADRIASRLDRIGYRHPEYLAAMNKGEGR